MSQQINLLLPELRPRFDWLALPFVVGAALLGLLVLFVLAEVQLLRVGQLRNDEAAVNGQLLNLQQQVQSLGQVLSSRKPNEALVPEIENAKTGVEQRQQVLSFIAQGDISKGGGFAGMLQGFSRQTVEGVWLVGFGLASSGIEIRGRLIDPALLPVYINKLNGDEAFAGRRFSALEMKGVEPVVEEVKDKTAQPLAKEGRYTEFVLRTESAPVQEKTP